jgi:AcrR family transcriptional regulator
MSGAVPKTGDAASARPARGGATRAALVGTARELFTERGYAGVGTEEVVRRAGVTRGALYHHFRDKQDLFRAVYEELEVEVVGAITARIDGIEDPLELLAEGVRAFLDACSDPVMMRIGLRDAPAVLGWEEWREIGDRHGLGLVTGGLQAAMDAGLIVPADVRTLAHILLSALAEASLLVASADDPRAARVEVERTLLLVLGGLRVEPSA